MSGATQNSDELDVVERYVEALAVFGNAVRDVAEHEWDLPTPCGEWNVKELVAHVVLGEAHLPLVLGGETNTTQTSFTAEMLGTNPLSTWRGTALRAIAAARAPGVAERIYDLDMGSLPGRQLLGYRMTDNIVHAWDVSIGVGRPAPVDERHAEWLLNFWQPVAAQIADSDFFGPPVEPATDSAGDRLLALLGRTVA